MRGVTDVIGPVCEVEIDRLKSQCDADGIMVIPKIPKFQKGQKVRPKDGALVDLVGEFVDIRREREVALFNILGAKRTIEFKEGDLVAA